MLISSLLCPQYLGFFSVTMFGLAQFLTIALYPALSETLGLPLHDLILSFTIGSVLFIWSAPFWARKSDVLGRMRILSIGLFGLSLSLIVLLSSKTFITLILGRIFYGLTAAAIVTVVQAWWRDGEGEVIKKMVSHSMGLNIGRLLAPALIWGFAGKLEVIIYCVSAVALILSVIALTGSLTVHQTPVSHEDGKLNQSSSIIYMAFFATTFIGVVHSLLAGRIQKVLSLSGDETSILSSKVLLGSGLIVLALQVGMKRLNSLSGVGMISIGLVSWVIFSALFSIFHSQEQLWLMIIFLSTGLATMTPGYLALTSAGGKAAGAINSTQTLGLTFGGALGFFYLKDNVSFEVILFALCGLMTVVFGKLVLKRGQYV